MAAQKSGTVLFQAPGWIEPRPSSTRVTALASGVLEELFVVAGQTVTKGQIIGRLNETDAKLRVLQARNSVSIREGELARAQAELEAAESRLNRPLHLEVELAESGTQLAKAESLRKQLPFLIEVAEAKEKYAQQNWDTKKSAQGAVTQRLIDEAQQDYRTAHANLRELQERSTSLDHEIAALKLKQQVLKQQLELRIDEQRQQKESQASVQIAEAMLAEAKIQQEIAELNLKRTEILAPMNGRVLSVIATPGTSLGDSDIHGQSTVLEMYDPARLQARVDVRLEDVPRVTPSQPVEIRTASVSGPVQGRVLQATSQANIQRNTLEVKVELIDPSSAIHPEMLVTATFLAPEIEPIDDLQTADSNQTLLIPKQLIQSGDTGSFVWIAGVDGLAQKRPIEIGNAGDHQLTEVKSGLNLTDALIVSGIEQLSPGTRVKIIGDDQQLGMGNK